MTTTFSTYRELEQLLVCPRDRGPLHWHWSDGVVYNPRLQIGYPIRDGIAQLLETESFPVDERGETTNGGQRG